MNERLKASIHNEAYSLSPNNLNHPDKDANNIQALPDNIRLPSMLLAILQ